MVRQFTWIAIFTLAAALTAVAHNEALARDLAIDHGDADPRNRASFYVEVMREVSNDWAVARLSIVEEGKDPARLADAVNRRMTTAVAAAKAVAEVEVQTGAYTTRPIHRDGRIVRWHAQQELRIESRNVDQLSELIGELQSDSVLLSGIYFSVSSKTRKSLEDELIEEALGAFRSRAALVAKGLGAGDWSLVGLSINGDGHAPERFPRRARAEMAMMTAGAPPALEAGSSEIRIRIDGTIELD
ncbi:MAG: SIMPL domain-containing protein [Myxococcales bacterium]|nr:SIMPL domain-containing protein [Myxococcales bacterium]